MFEHHVQNGVWCVNWCMDNAALAEPTAGQTVEQTVDKKKRKKDKVRSAWISFAGRIVAQMVGAIATVALGVMVLHRYTANDARPGPPAQETSYAQPAAHIVVITPAMLGLRGADERVWTTDRSCAPQLDGAAAPAAHVNQRTLLSR
jgi:hypothetical protein